MTHDEHPLELLYQARHNIHTAGAELGAGPYQPGDVPAYETAAVSILDGLYLLIDSLVEQCTSWHCHLFIMWPPPGYERLLQLHAILRTMLLEQHRHDRGR